MTNQLTTDHHHVFFTGAADPLSGWLAEHLRDMERDGWRVVSAAPVGDDLMFTMTKG